MADLVRSRTEIECLLNDFQQANESGKQRRTNSTKELKTLEARIATVTERIDELAEDLDARVTEEKEAKEAYVLRMKTRSILTVRLESTQSRLSVLYAKQGRAQQFTTQAARDKYLNDEIKSLQAYEKTQQKRIDDLSKDVDGATEHLAEVMIRSEEQSQNQDEQRSRLRKMGEEVTELRTKVDGMQEERK